MMLEGQNSVPLSGATFQVRWADEKHTVDDLFYIVRTLMPYGQPATLSKQEYIDIVAYILMMNGYPAGDRALPADPAVLNEIIIGSPWNRMGKFEGLKGHKARYFRHILYFCRVRNLAQMPDGKTIETLSAALGYLFI